MKLFSGPKSDTRLKDFFDRVGTILLSLVLALIVWLVAINRENPIVQGQYTEEIPISVRGMATTLGTVQNLSNETVQPEIKAPQKSWEMLNSDDFSAYVDLTGLDEGEHLLPIQIDVTDPSVKIMDVRRSDLMVELGSIVTQSVPIRIEFLDLAADGYQAEAPIYEPLSVQISGPRQLVYQVQEGEAQVFLQRAKQQVESIRAIVPKNSLDQKVEGVTIRPTTVEIVVPVVQIPGRKEVVVNPDLVGQPDSGYRLSSVIVEPNTVVLQGDNEVLSQLPGSIFTEQLLLTGATAELRQSISLILPPGVTARDGNLVNVTASITPIESSTRAQRPPTLQALGEGLIANVDLDTVTVLLSGPVPQLGALEEDDVSVLLDLSGLLPGVHVVTPDVKLPEGISQDGILPETVEVVITSLVPTTVPRVLLPPTQVPVESPLQTPGP